MCKFTEPWDDVDTLLGCLCIKQGNDDNVDYTLETRADSKTAKRLRVGEHFGVGMFDCIGEQWKWCLPTLDLDCLQKWCIGLTSGWMITGLIIAVLKLQADRATRYICARIDNFMIIPFFPTGISIGWCEDESNNIFFLMTARHN